MLALDPDTHIQDALGRLGGAEAGDLAGGEPDTRLLRSDLEHAVALGLGGFPASRLARTPGAFVAPASPSLDPPSGAPVVLAPGALPEEVLRLLADLGGFAAGRGLAAHVVGGVVRDLLARGLAELDLDVVLGGDAVTLARAWADARGLALAVHARFQTATCTTPGGVRIDLTSARRERYAAPGELPQVEAGTLLEDLLRRDFTVNALAASLAPVNFGTLVDPLGGRDDLARGVLRAHHPLSFVDDPTRMFRAARYGVRLGLTPDAATRATTALALEVRALDRVSGTRVFAEIAKALAEKLPLAQLEALDREGLLAAIHPALALDGGARERLVRAERAVAERGAALRAEERWVPFLAAALALRPEAEIAASAERLMLPGKLGAGLGECLGRLRAVLTRIGVPGKLSASEVHRALSPLPEALLVSGLALGGGRAVRRIEDYLDRHRDVHVALTGEDLKALGLVPGPRFREILDRLLVARLDGQVSDRAGELELVRKHFLA